MLRKKNSTLIYWAF